MKVFEVRGGFGIDKLVAAERPQPQPGLGEDGAGSLIPIGAGLCAARPAPEWPAAPARRA